jgi:hypothetical protein
MSDYTNPDRYKLKMLWMSRDYSTPDEQVEAAENFDRFMAGLGEGQKITKRDRQWFLGEHASCDVPVPHDHEDGEIVIHPDYHWRPPKKPEERKNASELMLELMMESMSAVELIPGAVAVYRQQLADQGLSRTADVKVGPDGEPVDPDSSDKGGIGGSMAGINVADQGALQYHERLLGMALGYAQMVVHERQFDDVNTSADAESASFDKGADD